MNQMALFNLTVVVVSSAVFFVFAVIATRKGKNESR